MLYKWTAFDGASCGGGTGKWSLPKQQDDGTWTPGRWQPRIKDIEPCERGYHLCRPQDLLWWIGPALWEAEADGPSIEHGSAATADSKVVVARARLLRPVTKWNERTARLFAADCAEQVLPLFERDRPDDDRPRQAIAVARAYADGAATRAELHAAGDAAWAAAGAAAGDAAWHAAGDARAAWAARHAAWDAWAAWAAWHAAWNARAAAWAAAGDAAWDAARAWQRERLQAYITGAVS